jgi:hypothetical protein
MGEQVQRPKDRRSVVCERNSMEMTHGGLSGIAGTQARSAL